MKESITIVGGSKYLALNGDYPPLQRLFNIELTIHPEQRSAVRGNVCSICPARSYSFHPAPAVFDLHPETTAVVASQLDESFYILFSPRDANTQQRGDERLPTAKLFSQLAPRSFFLCIQTTHFIHLKAHVYTQVAACCVRPAFYLQSFCHTAEVL